MENTIVITNGHLIAFAIGAMVGMLSTSLTIGLLIPSMVRKAFEKAHNK